MACSLLHTHSIHTFSIILSIICTNVLLLLCGYTDFITTEINSYYAFHDDSTLGKSLYALSMASTWVVGGPTGGPFCSKGLKNSSITCIINFFLS